MRAWFGLDSAGRDSSGTETAQIGRPKNGVAKFSFHLKRGTFAPDLADDGLANATANNVYLPTRVKVRLGSTTLEETFPLVWNVAAGGVGVAK